jgi:hypothetical protein
MAYKSKIERSIMSNNTLQAQQFLVRNALSSQEEQLNFTSEESFFTTVSNDRVFMEQLLLANPKLYSSFQKYNIGS